MMVFEDNELIGFLFKACVIVLLSGITALLFVPVKFKPVISIISVFLVGILTSFIAIKGFTAEGIQIIINGGSFFGEIPLRIDALTAWFILIINFTSVTGVLYGAGYLKSAHVQPSLISFHWILYILFQSSMLLVSMVQNSIAFIVAWEIMSLSSLLLVLFDYTNPKVLKAGINYLVQMHISVIFITIGFIWVYFKTGTFDFKGISIFLGSNVNIWLFLIFFAGFGLKAGFLGLHTWLPLAHPAAPSHISGVMSGVIVKMGIYGIFRIITCLKADYLILGEIIITLSLITGLFGIMNAAVHRDFKKMLAYCTIENIGIIGIGIGLGLIGIGKGQSMLIYLGFGGAFLMLLPQYFIIVVMIFIAFFPGYFINRIGTILNVNSFPNIVFNIVDLQWYVTVMKNISLASVLLMTVIGSVFFIRWILTRRTVKEYSSTWGCAWLAPNERMQYTGKSFSKSFGKLLNFLLIEKKGYAEIERNETFPDSRKYRSFYLDLFETKIIDPAILLIIRFINLFQFIQNGKIQAYVIYGIVFILTIFLGTVLNLWH